MSFFVLTYSRKRDRNPDLERFENADAAMKRFIERERALRRTDGDGGVVLLIAEDEETLRRTHTHYFVESVDEVFKALAR